jgi:hypothetical protein
MYHGCYDNDYRIIGAKEKKLHLYILGLSISKSPEIFLCLSQFLKICLVKSLSCTFSEINLHVAFFTKLKLHFLENQLRHKKISVDLGLAKPLLFYT